MNTLSHYQSFVLSKEAPPPSPSPESMRLIHAALGLAAEVLELDTSTSRVNTLEELGDLLWYSVLTADILEVDLSSLKLKVPVSPHENVLTLSILKEDVEAFVSLVKKQVIYGSDVLPSIYKQFFQVWVSLLAHMSCCSTDLNYILSTNMEKLDARYNSSFTTEESESRRDKQAPSGEPGEAPETD